MRWARVCAWGQGVPSGAAATVGWTPLLNTVLALCSVLTRTLHPRHSPPTNTTKSTLPQHPAPPYPRTFSDDGAEFALAHVEVDPVFRVM